MIDIILQMIFFNNKHGDYADLPGKIDHLYRYIPESAVKTCFKYINF